MSSFQKNILNFPLNELSFQTRYLIRKYSGFRGIISASVLSWNRISFFQDLKHYEKLYLQVQNELAARFNEQPNSKNNTFFRQKLNTYPEFIISDYIDQKQQWWLIPSLVFFPLALIILSRTQKRLSLLHNFLQDVLNINQQLIRANKRPEWSEMLASVEYLN